MLAALLVATLLTPRACTHTAATARPPLTRAEQADTRALIRYVVARLGGHTDFEKLLRLVAGRESSFQQGLVHRLAADTAASKRAFSRTHGLYDGNVYRALPELWQTYGLFGMNSNYFTAVWDRQGDPRVLCDPVIDILVYRRASVRALRRAGSTIECADDAGEQYSYTVTPTWLTIHRIVSGGKICPSSGLDTRFSARARRIGLDPDARVSENMLGREPAAWPSFLVALLWAEHRQRDSL